MSVLSWLDRLSGAVIRYLDTDLTQRGTIEFDGAGVVVVDDATDPTDPVTRVTVNGADVDAILEGASPAVVTSRITALDANHLHAWELTEPSGVGPFFVDTGSSASKVNLTATGTPLYGAPGIVGSCYQFGVDAVGVANTSYGTALVSAFSDLPTTAVTLEMWYCPYVISSGASLAGVWDTANNANFTIDAGSATSIEQIVRATSFKSGSSGALFSVFTPCVWHHVALTYDVATGFCLLYIDGEIVQKQTGQTGSVDWSNGTTPSFRVGVRGTATNPWIGRISRVRLSDIARSQAYCRAVYAKGMVI